MKKSMIILIISFVVTLGLLFIFIKKAPSLIHVSDFGNQIDFNVVAIGDSLTEGIGDEIGNGGYLPYLVSNINDVYKFNSISSNNYGKSGNITLQVIKRIKDSDEIKNNLKNADIVTITIGGNDLMQVIKDNFLDLTVDKFDKESVNYVQNLKDMYDEIRKYTDAPIYQLGIYNPFYLSFQEIEEMQGIVNNWNEKTSEVTKLYKDIYFVPINDQIYKGSGVDDVSYNDLLSSEDSFHPNNAGYKIIAKEFQYMIIKTESRWK